MRVARNGLDPVEAAKRKVARSKEVVASVAGDLSEFRSYLAEERRKREQHARWVRRQQAVLRRREWRHRTLRSTRRALFQAALAVRSVLRFVLNAGLSTLILGRDLVSGAALWTGGMARAVSSAAYKTGAALCAGMAWTARTARVAASAAFERGATGLSWTRARARSLALAGAEVVATAASWTAARTRRGALSSHAALMRGLSWLGDKARASALVGAAAILAIVSAATAAAQAVTLATAERLAAATERLLVKGTSLASKLQVQASAWGTATRATARDLALRTEGAITIVARSLRRNALRFGRAASVRIAATKPLLEGYGARAPALAAELRDRARAGLDRLSRAALRPLEGVVVSAPGSLRLRQWIPQQDDLLAAPEGLGDGASDHAATIAYEQLERGKALACIEPWRCKLPAVVPRQSGRQVMALN